MLEDFASYPVYVASILAAVITVVLTLVSNKMFNWIAEDEQLRVEKLTDVEVFNGPAFKLLLPFTYRSKQIVQAEALGLLDCLHLKDTVTGAERLVVGPQLLFLGPYEKQTWKGKGKTLTAIDYVLVENKSSGMKEVIRGPRVWYPAPQEKGTQGSALTLTDTEYVLVEDKETGEKSVQKGPQIWFPGPDQKGTKNKGITLGNNEYVLVEDVVTGKKMVEKGPTIWFPGANEVARKNEAITLSCTQYITVEDKLTGEKSIVKGPALWFPKEYDIPSHKKEALGLQEDEYLRLKDLSTGRCWVERGKGLVFLQPTWVVLPGKEASARENANIKKAWVLKKFEYVRLIDNVTGKVSVHRGEQVVFPQPDETCFDSDKMSAIDLKVNQYLKLLDKDSGVIRVLRGPDLVFLGAHEEIHDGGKKDAVAVDEEHAVLVRNKATGQLRLVTEKQLFVPGPDETIEQQQTLIKLADHEAIIVRDQDSVFQYYYGSRDRGGENPRSFFLPPHGEVVTLVWSRGPKRDKRDLKINKFDLRPQYMAFEFTCRTRDNVELILEGILFWEVVDLPRMVQTTGDTTGDVCNHTRSQFIKHVAKVTLKEFMSGLTAISQAVHKEDLPFYEARGLNVHSLEVTGYQCAEATTSEVLQQIIAETTNRMNRLSQQESENEVKIFKMQGQIEQEKLNGKLLEIQHEHDALEAKVIGQSEAKGAATFLDGISSDIADLSERLDVWQMLRKNEALSTLAQSTGGSNLYFTPKDVDLSITT